MPLASWKCLIPILKQNRNKMKYVCIALVRFYRKFLSPLKRRPCCRFTPTCSAYALEAFQKRGFFVGFILTVARIFRCQPLFPGGYDPVPKVGLRNPKNGSDGRENVYDSSFLANNRFVFSYDLPLKDCAEKSIKQQNK